MATIECAMPEEYLSKKEVPFDAPDAYGIFVEYWFRPADESLQPVRVAMYQRKIEKRNRFQSGETDPGFDPTGKRVVYSVQDNAREFVSVIEAYDSDGKMTNRGVHTELKAGQLVEMIQGSPL